MTNPSLPSAKVIHVDTRGAVILSEESPEVRCGLRSLMPVLSDNGRSRCVDKGQQRDLPPKLH